MALQSNSYLIKFSLNRTTKFALPQEATITTIMGGSWDVFICHASEDKEAVARPLAETLDGKGVHVWLDINELTLGDSLREKIDHGLANSRFGVVILSESFFSKDWPQRELNGLATREVKGRKVILPVWHGIDHESVAKYSPILADRLAAKTSEGFDRIANQIVAELRSGPGQSPGNQQTSRPEGHGSDLFDWKNAPDNIGANIILAAVERLPRPAKFLFLSACGERVAPLYTALCPKLLRYSYQRDLYNAVSLVEEFAYNQHVVERRTLELAKEKVETACVAAGHECNSEKSQLAAGAALMVRTLVATATEPTAEHSRYCMELAIGALTSACPESSWPLLVKTLVHDMKQLHTAIEEYGWTDESSAKGVLLRPVWPFGKPQGWPNEGVPFAIEVLKGTIANLTGYKLLKKLME